MDALLVPIKAVPGAKRDAIAGMLGERLKIRVSAAPEGGKANKALCALVARSLGLKPSAVSVETGHTNPEKVLRVERSGFASTRDLLAHLCNHPS